MREARTEAAVQLEAAALQRVLRGRRGAWRQGQHRGHGVWPPGRPEVQRPQRAELLRSAQLGDRHLARSAQLLKPIVMHTIERTLCE